MAKLNKKKQANDEAEVGENPTSPEVIEDSDDNEYVFYLASAQDGECNSALADEYGEIKLHFINKKVRLPIPKNHNEQILLKKRMASKHFELVHSPEMKQILDNIIETESMSNREVEYWVFQHSDRAKFGESFSGDIALKLDTMTSVAIKCDNGVIKVTDQRHAKALSDAGYIEITVQYKA